MLAVPVKVIAVIFQIVILVNVAWPRREVYGDAGWYFQWAAFLAVGASLAVGWAVYYTLHRGGRDTVGAEHSAELGAPSAADGSWSRAEGSVSGTADTTTWPTSTLPTSSR